MQQRVVQLYLEKKAQDKLPLMQLNTHVKVNLWYQFETSVQNVEMRLSSLLLDVDFLSFTETSSSL